LLQIKPDNSKPGGYFSNRKYTLMVTVRKLKWGRRQGEILHQKIVTVSYSEFVAIEFVLLFHLEFLMPS